MFSQYGRQMRTIIQLCIHLLLALLSFSIFVAPAQAATTEVPKLLTTIQMSIQKAVFNEQQNEGCKFQKSPFTDEIDHHGVLHHCRAGYRTQNEGEDCHGRYGCCVCEQGTYQPYPNTCMHCIQKTFCPDYRGLEFEDYGSHVNNSRCKDIATESDTSAGGDTILLTPGTQDPTTDAISTFPTTGEVNTEFSTLKNTLDSLISFLKKKPDVLVFLFCVIPVCTIALLFLVFIFGWIVVWCVRHRMILMKLCWEKYHEAIPTDETEDKLQTEV